MTVAICDTSVLIRLRKGEVIHCLANVFDQILVPGAVQNECKDEKAMIANGEGITDNVYFETIKEANE